jgi:hypothetical protein
LHLPSFVLVSCVLVRDQFPEIQDQIFSKEILDSTLLSIFGDNPPRRTHIDQTPYRDTGHSIWKTKPARRLLDRLKVHRATFYNSLLDSTTKEEVKLACKTFSQKIEQKVHTVTQTQQSVFHEVAGKQPPWRFAPELDA